MSILVLAGAVAVVGMSIFAGAADLGAAAAGTPRPRVGAETPLTAENVSTAPSNNSPAFAVDPADDRFVVLANRLDAPGLGCALQVSGNSGNDWAPAAALPRLPAGAAKCYAPEVAFDGHGRLYFLFAGLAGAGNRPIGIFLSFSSDRARTFSPPQLVLGPLNFSVHLAVDSTFGSRGRLHLVWLHAESDVGLGAFGPPPNPILASHSDDGGATFSSPVQVSDANRERVVAPALALGPRHTIYVAYYDFGRDAVDYQNLEGPSWPDPWSVVSSTSTDGGQHFNPGVAVDNSVTPPGRVMLVFTMPPPSLAVDGERVCVAWTDARQGDPDAMLRCSPNKGTTWQGLERLNDDAVNNGRSQYLPRLSISPDGRLDAVFFDRRNDPQNRRYDVFYTYSADGGRHFARNVRLTEMASDSHIGAQYTGPAAHGQYEIGNRLGLLSMRASVLAAWPDARNSAVNTTAQDIFVRTVDGMDTREHRAKDWARLSGGLVIGAGLLIGIRALVTLGRRSEAQGTRLVSRRVPHASELRSVGRSTLIVAALATAGLVACQVPGLSGAPEFLPKASPVVRVTMVDYRFRYTAPRRGERVVFRFVNAGHVVHSVTLLLLPEDLPPINAQLHGTDRRFIQPVAQIPPLQPGARDAFAVDLQPGARYALICFERAANGESHALMGMNSEFRSVSVIK